VLTPPLQLDFDPSTPSLGFTGTRSINEQDRENIARVLRAPSLELESFKAFVTGACIGVDAYVGELMSRWFPQAEHIVVVPADRTRVDSSYLKWANHIINMPKDTSYRDRNTQIVSLSNKLIGFPRYPEQDGASRRSGTWMTIRLARRKGVTYKVFVLNFLHGDREDAEEDLQ
jgi:hypothetical protein